MEVKNNPAGRLLDILNTVKGSNSQAQLNVVWARALGCEVNDTGELLRLWSDLIRLTQEAKHAISKLDHLDEKLYLAPFRNIENLLNSVNFAHRWNDVKGHLDDKTMLGLQFGAERLGREGAPSAVISSEEVTQFLSELEKLLTRVLDSELPKDLMHLFARNLEQIRHALIAFRISGAAGLTDELDRSIGSLLRHQADIQEQTSDDEKEMFKAFFDLLERMNNAVTFVQNAKAIAAPAVTVLLSLFKSAG